LFYNNFHIFTKTRKKKKPRNQETKLIFEGSYLGNALCDLAEIWNVRCWHWQAFPLQKLFCFVKVSQSYVRIRTWKLSFLFFLLITHWCGAPASWAAQHTTVCLDISLYVKWTLDKTVYVWYFVTDYNVDKNYVYIYTV